MNESLFIQFIQRLFPKLQPLIEKINGKRNTVLTYLHKSMLRKEYSPDQKWESASVNTTYVAADMVAMDSPLAPKMRDAIATASGKLPKIGIKKQLNESQINGINIMRSQGQTFASIANKLVQDPVACSVGIDEKNEYNFLTALSDGVICTEDSENPDIALRVNFNFLKKNCFGVSKKGVLDLEDIRRVLDKANDDGVSISRIAIALSTYNKLRQSRGARELVASAQALTYTDATKLPVPSASAFDAAFADEFGGVTFLKIDRSIIVEKNGVRKSVKPFNANKLTFLVSDEVGALVWGTLAEMTNPVPGVAYATIDEFKLISRYSKNDPLREFTKGEAFVLPVLEDIDQIYSLDIAKAEEVNTTKENSDTTDVKVTIGETTYNKAGLINAAASIGVTIKANATDEEIINIYNLLSDAKKKKLAEAAAGSVVA